MHSDRCRQDVFSANIRVRAHARIKKAQPLNATHTVREGLVRTLIYGALKSLFKRLLLGNQIVGDVVIGSKVTTKKSRLF